MKNIIFTLILVLYTQGIVSQGCKNVNISIDTRAGNTVVRDGLIATEWLQKQDIVLMDANSTDLDYLYVTITSQNELKENNFFLEFSDHEFAHSSIKIEKVTKTGKNTRLYSIRINYKCKNYGGKLIRYSFTIKGNFKECENQKTTIYWDRLCGDERQSRKGLTIEYDFAHKYNQTVVKDGLLSEASYFDQDLENFVFKVPAKYTYSIFYVYMQNTKSDLLDKNFTDEDLQKYSEGNDPSRLDIMQAILELIPLEELQSPQLNYDEQILQPVIKGDLVNGGMVGLDKQTIYIEYNCLQKGTSEVQLTIPLSYFKDINLYFIKECPYNFGEEIGLVFGFFEYFFITCFIAFAMFFMFTQFLNYGTDGFKSFKVLLNSFIVFVSSLPIISTSEIGKKMYSYGNYYQQLPTRYQSSGSDYKTKESEFKIKNMFEKEKDESQYQDNINKEENYYGSI